MNEKTIEINGKKLYDILKKCEMFIVFGLALLFSLFIIKFIQYLWILIVLFVIIIIPCLIFMYNYSKKKEKICDEIYNKMRNKLIEAYKKALEKRIEITKPGLSEEELLRLVNFEPINSEIEKWILIEALDKDCFTFENQLKIIYAIPAKSMVDLFASYNRYIIYYNMELVE